MIKDSQYASISSMNTEEVFQEEIEPQPAPSSRNIFTSKASLVLIGCTIVGLAFAAGLIAGKNRTTPAIPPTEVINQAESIQQDPQVAPAVSFGKIVHIYPSLDRQFSFYVYPYDMNQGLCLFGLTDSQGFPLDLRKLLGTDKIVCAEGNGNIESSFVSWVDGDIFLLDEQVGEIKIVNVKDLSVENYPYIAGDIGFVGADRSLRYWLFRESKKDSISYKLLDRNGLAVMNDITFESNDRGAMFDEANNGFLFVSRTFTGEGVSISFDFLSLDTLTMKNILTTEPTATSDTGCSSEYMLSQPGEIILTPGCLTVPDKHLGSDGNIHIRL